MQFKLMPSELQLKKLKCVQMCQYNVFNFFILICIFVRPAWLFVRSKLASGLTNDLSMGKNYLQACMCM